MAAMQGQVGASRPSSHILLLPGSWTFDHLSIARNDGKMIKAIHSSSPAFFFKEQGSLTQRSFAKQWRIGMDQPKKKPETKRPIPGNQNERPDKTRDPFPERQPREIPLSDPPGDTVGDPQGDVIGDPQIEEPRTQNR
ncbi:MAG: hypothetical protein JO188_20735 [Hyphomicrobiales bacterium]|nr:hypothetical protein [Hyphomicrobiales bacterium]